MDKVEIVYYSVSIVLNIVAIILSIYSIYKSNTIKKKNKYYDDIFKPFLLHKIPDIYRKYTCDEKSPNLPVEKEFEKEIQDFRDSIIPMDFIDSRFHESIENQLVSIEDTVVRISNHPNEYGKFKVELHGKICELYKIINKFFSKE